MLSKDYIKDSKKNLRVFSALAILLVLSIANSLSQSSLPNFSGKCKKWFVPAAADNPVKYFNSAEDSCKDYIMRFRPGETWVNGNYVNGSDQYTCNSDFSPVVSITNAERAVRDDCCEEVVLGPYSDIINDGFKMRAYYSFNPPKYRIVTLPPLRGMEYNNTQRQKILMENIATHGSLQSDVNAYMIPGVNDYCTNLITSDPNDDCAAQVHHIIPRKDSKGCDCGTNSNTNAVVISRKLNNEISNDCNSPKLKAILDFFKLSPINLLENNTFAVKLSMKPKAKVKVITPAIREQIKKYVERMKD
jgi:hypothetical protein